MLRHGLMLLVLCLLSIEAHSQFVVRGVLLNEADGKPVSYANIGILNKNLGTISNTDGTFEIRLDMLSLKESLIFSALGFEKKVLEVQQLTGKSFNRIMLKESPEVLEAITILPDLKKVKARRLAERGNSTHTAGTIRLDTAKAGGSMALLINNNKNPFYLEKARLYIVQNSLDTFKVRVRLYKKDEATGLPGDDLLDKSVVIASSIEKGWLEVDLAFYNILLKEKEFFLAFEWIMDKADRQKLASELLCFLADQPESLVAQRYQVGGKEVADTKISGFKGGTWFGATYLPAVVKKNTCYYRLSSMGEWKRSAAIMTAEVLGVTEK